MVLYSEKAKSIIGKEGQKHARKSRVGDGVAVTSKAATAAVEVMPSITRAERVVCGLLQLGC